MLSYFQEYAQRSPVGPPLPPPGQRIGARFWRLIDWLLRKVQIFIPRSLVTVRHLASLVSLGIGWGKFIYRIFIITIICVMHGHNSFTSPQTTTTKIILKM
jgi:hypothetical protein